MKVHDKRSVLRPRVTCDGEGLVSHAGTSLLSELADRSRLTKGLSAAMAGCGIRWRKHDPGYVLTHLAVAIADGADCLSDMDVIRQQSKLFGPVASQATAWRAVEAVTAKELRGIMAAITEARAVVWAGGRIDPDVLTFDFDATLVDAYSEKQDAKPTYKKGFGFHPFGVWLDETSEPLAAMLRPGNAGANNSEDHIALFEQAVAALPPKYRVGHGRDDNRDSVACPILVRVDSAGASHRFVDVIVDANTQYSIGYPIDERVRDALNLVQEEHWVPAVERDVALLIEESVEVGAMLAEARKWSKKGLEKVEVFDVFRGGKLPEAKKSVALGMTWRAPDRTLTDDDVNALHEKLVASLVEKFQAEQR